MKRIYSLLITLLVCFGLLTVSSSAAVSVTVKQKDSQKVSDSFLEAKKVKLTGKLYSTSKHGAYFTVLEEDSSGKYFDNKTEFHNYLDTGSKTDSRGRYKAISFISNETANKKARAMRVRINPYRQYNDIDAYARIDSKN